jgi:hypothetical protein
MALQRFNTGVSAPLDRSAAVRIAADRLVIPGDYGVLLEDSPRKSR